MKTKSLVKYFISLSIPLTISSCAFLPQVPESLNYLDLTKREQINLKLEFIESCKFKYTSEKKINLTVFLI
jgi:hypothetical protein